MTPISRRTAAAAAAVAILLAGSAGRAQTSQPEPRPDLVLKTDVVISRHQGSNLVASLPYTLMVNVPDRGSNRVSLRMGVDVPIGTTTTTTTRGTSTESTTATTKPEYRHIGTSIDAWAERLPDGRFRVSVSTQDSSFYGDAAQAMRSPDAMAFRTFSLSNTLVMAVGETRQFAAATDRVSGEVVKLDVTIGAVK